MNAVQSPVPRRLVVACTLLVSLVFAAVVLDQAVEEYDGRHSARQFYVTPPPESLLTGYGQLFGVAHNSGNRIDLALRAVEYQADAVEIDVILSKGQLLAAHRRAPRLIRGRIASRPTLEEAWRASEGAPAIKLDLKQSSPALVAQVLDFLAPYPDRHVVVASRDAAALERFHQERPSTVRLLSVSSAARLEGLLATPAELAVVDGVTAYHGLITHERMSALREAGLVVVAWTVNDIARLNELLDLGVDAITTDNLAIIELLTSTADGDRPLPAWLERKT